MHHALCIMHHASCFMHHASCIMHYASCILRAEVAKFRCSDDADRVSGNHESRSSKVPMLRGGYPKFLRPRKYEMLSKEIGNSEQRNRKENAWSPNATKFRRYDVPKMRRPGQCPSSATVEFASISCE